MSDLLSWTDPRSTAVLASTQTELIAAVAALFASDAHWEINASASDWIELKPKAGPYQDDRILINGTNVATNAAMMLRGAAPAINKVAILMAHGDGGSGPSVANLDTATGPYTGGHTGYAEWVPPAVAGVDLTLLNVVTCRDGIMFSASAANDGNTWWAFAGRMIQTLSGADRCMVTGTGTAVTGTFSEWATQTGSANVQINQPFTTDTIETTGDTSRMGWTDGTSKVQNLIRINGIYGSSSANDAAQTGVFMDMIVATRPITRQLIGKIRQLKIGGPRRNGVGVWVDAAGASRRKVYIGSDMLAANDTLWLTDYE